MQILVLGGSGYLGRFFLEAALEAGHQVSVFSRGERPVLAGVEQLTGDRDGDLGALGHRDFDAVLDVSTFGPRWVRSLASAIAERTGHYTFISSQDVYAVAESSLDRVAEDAPLRRYEDPSDPFSHSALYRTEGLSIAEARRSYLGIARAKQMYGSLKVLCENEAQAFGNVLVLRPTLIVGTGDRNPAFPFLVGRLARGGEVLVTGAADAAVQLIDARDVARWWVRLVEGGVTGVFNVAGPAAPLTFGALLTTIARSLGIDAHYTFVDTSWLVEQADFWPMGALFWSQQCGGFNNPGNLDVTAAVARGLSTRALGETVRWIASGLAAATPDGDAMARVAGLRAAADGRLERVAPPWESYLATERDVLTRWRERRSPAEGGDTGGVRRQPGSREPERDR